PLGRSDVAMGALGFVALPALAFVFGKFLSPRATFIHVGAVVGTIMAANVWMRILPSQRKMLAAAKEGKTPEANVSARGPQRSKHNSYLVVPLVFTMISNHYPVIFGSKYNWLMLSCAIAGGWIVAKIFRG